MRWSVDNDFEDEINGNMLCRILAAICHTLCAWQTGTYVEPWYFKRVTSLGMLRVPYWLGNRFTDTSKDLLQRQHRT